MPTSAEGPGGGAPEHIGPYRIEERIGRGGQGTVYLGRGPDGAEVAVKVLTGAGEGDALQRARFARELESARRVAPFCTAAVVEADLEGDPPYIASEFVRGPTLRAAVHREGPRTGAALDRLAVATATALVAIHSAGVVHRDFKPANVLLGSDGPRVIDFGIARTADATLTRTGSVTGTPAYMAPEQVRGSRVGPEADMFAWAAVIAFAASGRPPFDAGTVQEVLHRVVTGEPNLAEVPERLRPLLVACLDKDPARRPTAVRVLGALVGRDPGPEAEGSSKAVTTVLLEGVSAAAGRTAPAAAPLPPDVPGTTGIPGTPGTRRTGRTARGGPVLAALVALLLLGGTVWLLFNGLPGFEGESPSATPARETSPAEGPPDQAPEGGSSPAPGQEGHDGHDGDEATPQDTPEETPYEETHGESPDPPTGDPSSPTPSDDTDYTGYTDGTDGTDGTGHTDGDGPSSDSPPEGEEDEEGDEDGGGA